MVALGFGNAVGTISCRRVSTTLYELIYGLPSTITNVSNHAKKADVKH